MALCIEQQFQSILDPVLCPSLNTPELIVGVFSRRLVLRCFILEIEPGEDPAADAIVGEGLQGLNAEVTGLSPLGVQYHPIAVLRSKVGKSLVASIPAKLFLNIFLLGGLLPLAKKEEVNDFHALAFSNASLLQEREAHLTNNFGFKRLSGFL